MSDTPESSLDRRPIATREVRLVRRVASWLARTGISPNAISISSIGFGVAGGFCLAATSHVDGWLLRGAWFAAAVLIQCRLLANMFDGMVAIESGQASPVGTLYNEVPDRIADPLILIGAGFAAGGAPTLGYVASLLAIFVAYVRVLGGAVGARDLFVGPMAKPQRMAMLTVACLYSACVPSSWPGGIASGSFRASWHGWFASESFGAMSAALALIVIGAALTAVRRLWRIVAQLRERA